MEGELAKPIQNGGQWFQYRDSATTGVTWAIQMDQILHKEMTPYQEILIFKSIQYGVVLALDGQIQCTEKDEFIYSEMMAHVPLNCHPNPKQVLIIGGGDGGVLREVLKHKEVEIVTQVEIDEKVIDACKKHFPEMTQGYGSKRCNLIIGDGADYIKQSKNAFDAIIIDCTDPQKNDTCRATVLYKQEFWMDLKDALRPGGIVTTLEETLYYAPKEVVKGLSMNRSLFPSVAYAQFFVPSFCTDEPIRICSTQKNFDFETPVRKWTLDEREKLGIRYYNESVHRAAFAEPDYAKNIVNPDQDTSG